MEEIHNIFTHLEQDRICTPLTPAFVEDVARVFELQRRLDLLIEDRVMVKQVPPPAYEVDKKNT